MAQPRSLLSLKSLPKSPKLIAHAKSLNATKNTVLVSRREINAINRAFAVVAATKILFPRR